MGRYFITLSTILAVLAVLAMCASPPVNAGSGQVYKFQQSNVTEPGSLGGQTIGFVAENETGHAIGSMNKTMTFELFPDGAYNGEARTISYGKPSRGIYNERPDAVLHTVFMKITNLPVGGQMINMVGRAHE